MLRHLPSGGAATPSRGMGSLSARVPRRSFYNGRLVGMGRAHPALKDFHLHVHAPQDPTVQINHHMWKNAWTGTGPLLHALDRDPARPADTDDKMCYSYFERQQVEASEWAKWYAEQGVLVAASKKQKRAGLQTVAKKDWLRRLWQARFESSESWENRCPLDWAAMDDDTVTRLVLWEVYGPLENCASPPTMSMDLYIATLKEEAERRGLLADVQNRNRELWTEMLYHATVHDKAELYRLKGAKHALDEKLQKHIDRTVEQSRVKSPEDAWNEKERMQTFIHGRFRPPLPDPAVPVPPPEALAEYLKLVRWYKSSLLPKLEQSRAAYVAKQNAELKILEQFISSLHGKVDSPRLEALKEDFRTLKDTFNSFLRRDSPADWEAILRGSNDTERAFLYDALPDDLVSAPPIDSLVFEATPDPSNALPTVHHSLTELLCDSRVKRSVAFSERAVSGAGTPRSEELRRLLYDNARLLARGESHHIYSGQAASINKALQYTRRKLEVLQNAIRGEVPEHFEDDRLSSNIADELYQPDPYATTIDNVTVYDHHLKPHTTTPYVPPDLSPGVKM